MDKNSEAVYDQEENDGQPKNLTKNQSAGQRKESVAEKNQKPFVPLKCILDILIKYPCTKLPSTNYDMYSARIRSEGELMNCFSYQK